MADLSTESLRFIFNSVEGGGMNISKSKKGREYNNKTSTSWVCGKRSKRVFKKRNKTYIAKNYVLIMV